jgi:DNA-binding IclR family transcriptional regulator
VIAKAVALMEALAQTPEATSAELAATVGEPRSSVYRSLNILTEHGLVEPGATRGTHRLGLKLLQLGSVVASRLDVRRAALPVMERIHDETGETLFLCIRKEREAVCIERIDGRRAAVMELKLGGSLPLHAGASPRAILAFEDRSEWDQYLSGGPIEDPMSGARLSRKTVIEQLTNVRARGVSISDEDLSVGFAAVAAPIFDHGGAVVAALALSGIRPAILGEAESHSCGLVIDGAAEISKTLGYAGDAPASAAPL